MAPRYLLISTLLFVGLFAGLSEKLKVTPTKDSKIQQNWQSLTIAPPPVCTGQLSDNIYTDGTFGSGPDIINPTDPGFSFDYNYQILDQTPPVGNYTLVNNTSNWLPLGGTPILPTGDISTDPEGYMFAVNTSADTSTIVWESNVPVCELTTYEITISFLNLLDPVGPIQALPSVDVGITPFIYLSTGGIPQDGDWHTYSFQIFTPPGIFNLPLFIKNTSLDATGSLLAIDDISIQACGPTLTFLSDTTVCANDTLDISFTYEGTQFGLTPVFQWQQSVDTGMIWTDIPGATDTIFTVQTPIDGHQYRLNIASSATNIGDPACQISSEAITLEVYPIYEVNLVQNICAGDSIQIGSSVYDMSGTYTDTLASINGCDSVVNLNLTILPQIDTTIIDTICEGQLYFVGTTPYFATGVYMDTLPAVNACDSIITLDLTVLPNSDTLITTTICFGDSVVVGDSVYVDEGVYITVIDALNGCDSTVLLELDVYPKISVNIDTFICEGEFFFVGGSGYFQPGNYMDTLVSLVNGCDSVVNLDLEVLDTAFTTINATICAGQIYPVGSSQYFETGQYLDVLSTFQGCDSSVLLNLIVLDTSYTELEFTLCEGETVSVANSIYSSTGIYFDTLNAANGCDSVIRTDLIVNDTFLLTVDQVLCVGDTYNGMEFENDTTVIEFLQSVNNCDSTVFVNLLISELEEILIKGDTLICEDDTTSLFVAADNPIFNYEWSNQEMERIILVDEPGVYTVTVTDPLGCQLTSSQEVEQIIIDAALSSVPPTCFGFKDGSISVDTFYGGSAPYEFKINDRLPQDDPVFTAINSGLFTIEVFDDNGCMWTGLIEVDEPEAFIVELGPDINISLNDTVTLFPEFNHPVAEVTWIPDLGLTCSDCPNPIASPFETTEYQIQAIDIDGCRADDRFTIKIGKVRNVFIPNAFSPNFDGINDYFMIFGGEDVVQVNRMMIFDRWGNLMFENINMTPGDELAGWDGRFQGKNMPAGVYVFWAELLFIDDDTRIYEGGIHLMR